MITAPHSAGMDFQVLQLCCPFFFSLLCHQTYIPTLVSGALEPDFKGQNEIKILG